MIPSVTASEAGKAHSVNLHTNLGMSNCFMKSHISASSDLSLLEKSS